MPRPKCNQRLRAHRVRAYEVRAETIEAVQHIHQTIEVIQTERHSVVLPEQPTIGYSKRRVEVNEIPRLRLPSNNTLEICMQQGGLRKTLRRRNQLLPFRKATGLGRRVRNVEPALHVRPVKAIETVSVQIDEPRGPRTRREPTWLLTSQTKIGVLTPSHPTQMLRDTLRVVPDRPIGANQFAVQVGEHCRIRCSRKEKRTEPTNGSTYRVPTCCQYGSRSLSSFRLLPAHRNRGDTLFGRVEDIGTMGTSTFVLS